jgi:hypothetical protein
VGDLEVDVEALRGGGEDFQAFGQDFLADAIAGNGGDLEGSGHGGTCGQKNRS